MSLRSEYESDPRSNEHYLMGFENIGAEKS